MSYCYRNFILYKFWMSFQKRKEWSSKPKLMTETMKSKSKNLTLGHAAIVENWWQNCDKFLTDLSMKRNKTFALSKVETFTVFHTKNKLFAIKQTNRTSFRELEHTVLKRCKHLLLRQNLKIKTITIANCSQCQHYDWNTEYHRKIVWGQIDPTQAFSG